MSRVIRSTMFCFALLALPVFVFTGCNSCDHFINNYDQLSELDEICSQKWSDYEAQLQRRSDLIPNLVNVVKAAASSEEKIMKEVMEARAQATKVTLSADDFSNEEKLKQFQAAQAAVGNSLSRLLAVQESYPELKSNQNFRDLQVQIEGTENRILRARTEYNKSAKNFNAELRKIRGGKLINPLTGNEFKPRIYFQAAPGSEKASEVKF